MRQRSILLILLILLCLGGSLSSAGPARANAPIAVNNSLADAPDAAPGNGACETAGGNGICTLRAAVMEANAYPGADTIIIPSGPYYLGLVATSHEDAALNGDLDITGDLTITGAGAAATIIDGNRSVTNARVFQILSGATVTISDLTIRNGTNEPSPSSVVGGVLNHGVLTMERVTITDNFRGGFTNQGVATLKDILYTNNTGNGACLSNNDGGTLIVLDSTIAGNINDSDCGGVWAGRGNLTLVNTTVNDNSGGSGAGMTVSHGTATLINSTISGNSARNGGGGISLWQCSTCPPTILNLYNVTIANNRADNNWDGYGSGGGIYVNASDGVTPIVNARNTLIANNVKMTAVLSSDPDDCSGPLNSEGYNLIETTAGCTINGVTTGNVTGIDPKLDPLANNGGPTQTRALQSGSPAIDAGNPGGCADGLGALLSTDQRGYTRPAGGRCDIGAFEFGAAIPASTPTPTPSPTPPGSSVLQQLHLPLIMR